ncbi:deoxyhypusine synthase family protein [Patescibacteria group bacterium]|nr:deoxyhypusine synthase family protein [Patescibacteria group bacterium]MBU4274422.1 deoxyhypusine synthase family protein [Patescibacteria group bacterium]MBU4368062.1 deoxyhypusine synthase family protein [Patescibacteria group bacterium]MBU4462233.1 deoxyhypusine synthase family protein [Patescibacteria group bacterium]MCG2699589.1 deoxyhypusine synthase family protein [Candidatus Parcubacteria bacterium]
MKKRKCDMMGRGILPINAKLLVEKVSFKLIIESFGRTCFEARNVAEGAKLFKKMIEEGDTIWLGIAGAGIVGGLGGYVIELIKRGFIDAICTTGAQAYHDLHFAFGLPVKQGDSKANDNKLHKQRIVRIYDMYIDEEKTLLAQDELIREFCSHQLLPLRTLENLSMSSADFNFRLGNYVLETAKFPERSFLAAAADNGVPVYFDSGSNHSIGMNLAAEYLNGLNVEISSSLDILESAAIVYNSKTTGFFELGGGGPKNFIQQTSPTIKQILGIDFEGADRGLQITTALERDGGLSGCTFNEGVTWGKYKKPSKDLVQIFCEYSIVFPLIAGYVLENCKPRKPKQLVLQNDRMLEKLKKDRKN